MLQYDIHKDAKPKDTVKRIKNILKENKIKVRETNIIKTFGNYITSLRVVVENTNIGTNGKGNCSFNSRASAYAEFMERLQSQLLFHFSDTDFCEEPDEIISEQKLLVKNELFKNIHDENFIFKLNSVSNTSRRIVNLLKNGKNTDDIKENETILIPFVSYQTGKKVYLPKRIISFMQNSNGYASGNTYEEAIVQACSEIAERFVIKEVFEKNIKLPLIPDKFYNKYSKLVRLIKYIESRNYKVTVKDASLGKGFCVVCIVFEDLLQKRGNVCLKFGAHPFLPVAIERCLTEFLQGTDINNPDERKLFGYLSLDENIEKDYKIIDMYTSRVCFGKTTDFVESILSDEGDYPFDSNIWLTNESCSNKELAKKILGVFLKYTNDIYIRNYNFLGFPCVLVCIPDMSYYINHYKSKIDNYRALHSVFYSLRNNSDYSVRDLFIACDNIAQRLYRPSVSLINTSVPIEMLCLYCAIFLKNTDKINQYYHLIKNKLNNDRFVSSFEPIVNYFNLQNKASCIYNNESSVIKSIKNIDENFIKSKVRCIIEKKGKDNEDINSLGKVLGAKYKNNYPVQNELSALLKEIKVENVRTNVKI